MNAGRLCIFRTALLIALASCSTSSEPVGHSEKPKIPATAQAQAPIPSRGGPSIDEGTARALLAQWLDAQNKGDFASYEKLYAARAYGEKRAAARLYKFDRKGWLSDRKRMFARPMQVSAQNIAVNVGPGTTVLSFEQTFSQASFQDRGQKRITLIREQGEARISTELMLASEVTTESASASQDFFFVVHVAGRPYAVLMQGAQRSWAAGTPDKPYVNETENTYVVLQATQGLPTAQAAWSGKALRVVDSKGQVCDGKVSTLKLMAAIVPHFGSVQAWKGTLDPEHPEPPATDGEVATAVLDSVWDGDLALVGQLEGCDGSFAMSPERSVRVHAATPLGEDVAAEAKRTLLSLGVYKQAQKAYLEAARSDDSLDTKQPWADSVDVRAFGSDASILSVHARRGAGCDSYSDNLTTLMRMDRGKLVELSSARPTAMPSLVLDLDQDEVLELVMGDGEFDRDLVRFSAGKPVVMKGVPTSFLDCGC